MRRLYIVCMLGALPLGWLSAGWVHEWRGSKINQPSPVEQEKSAKRNKVLALEGELKTLRKIESRRAPRNDHTFQEGSPSRSSAPSSAISPNIMSMAQVNRKMNLQEEKVARLKKNYAEIPGYELNTALLAAYSAEPYKESWAEKRHKKLEGIFKQDRSLQGANVKSIDCRSKHCRVEIFYKDVKDISDICRALSGAIMRDEDGSFVSALESGNSDTNKIVSIYLTDDIEASLY